MDYSIYDAISAGFDKVVFVIRKDLESDFREVIGDRISKKVEVEYAYQEVDSLPAGYGAPMERTKPWGTGHAVLCAREAVNEPFLVINADDYYGRDSFAKIYDYLTDSSRNDSDYCMVGFVLGNSLSEHGTVNRAICSEDDRGMLTKTVETYRISRVGDKAVGYDGDGNEVEISLDVPVSMTMWGFNPNFFLELEKEFLHFLDGLDDEKMMTSEYILTAAIDSVINSKKAEMKVIKTDEKWFGVTYKEDKPAVVEKLQKFVDEGRYPESII